MRTSDLHPPRHMQVGSPRTDWVEQVALKTTNFSPSLTETEQRLSLAIYKRFRLGEPASSSALALTTGIARTEVERALDSWPGVFRNEAGDVMGHWGLSITQMAHSIRIDGRELWAWCAWDTLFLPLLMGVCAEVTSKDPVTGNSIRLSVTPAGVEGCETSLIVMSCLIPDDSMSRTLVSSFCCHIHFFESAKSAKQFTPRQLFLMTLEEAVLFARLWSCAQYPSVLGVCRRL